MSKSIASSVLLAGAILLAILLPGCSDEPTPSPVAKVLPSATATVIPIPTPSATLTPTPTRTATPIATPSPVSTAMPVTFTELGIYNDNVFVLPVSEDLVVDGAAIPLPLEEYTKRFYEHFEDKFDFLIVARNLVYGLDTLDPCAYYTSVKNDVQGIGEPLFSNTGRWGSPGRLQGVIGFRYVGYASPEEQEWTPIGRGPGLHEVMHRWANFAVPTVDGFHWGFSSANGILGGFDIALLEDHGSGQYTAGWFNTNGTAGIPYSPLELYLAGLAPPEEVPDLWVAEDGEWLVDSEGNRRLAPNGYPFFTASRIRTLTIEDIIAEHGPRIPDFAQSQRDFRAAVILLVNEDHPANPQVLERLSEEISWVSVPAFTDEGDTRRHPGRRTNFYESANGQATITMDGLAESLISVPTATPTQTPTPTATPTPVPTATPTATPTHTSTPVPTATPSGTAASDRAALIAFYNSMDGSNWKNNTNWLSDKPIGDWYGITTENGGRVIGIAINYNDLNGQIPLQFGELAALEELELHGIEGDNPDLSALSDLLQLRVLSLGESGISDLSALMGLPRLTHLYLYTNQISDVSPLLSVRSLEYLSLVRNPLSGSSVYTYIPVLQKRGVTVRHSGYALTGGDVTIEDGPLIHNDNLVVLPASRGLALQAYARSFYKHFEDDFDFLVLVSPDNVHELGSGGYYLTVANDVQGTGQSTFSHSREFGSAGRLKGLPFFSHVWWFRGIILHEVLHQWAAYGSHPMVSSGHFTHFSNILGAFGGAFSSPFEEIVDLGDNRYKAEKRGWFYRYGPLDLYFAGLVPPEDVPDFWVAIDGEWIDQESGTFTATKIEKYTVSDVIAAYGKRVPEASRSQREFRAAVILLIDEKDPTVDSKLLESLSADIAWFSFPGMDESEENNFYEATGGRATLTMDGLSEFLRDTPQPTATPTPTPPPDLVVDTPTLSDSSPMEDQALTLRVTVGNRGSGSSGPTTLTYYRSDDSTITPADTEVGTDGVAGLGASESSAESTLTYAPSTPGTYYYGVCVDSMPGEPDTTNNCSAVEAATVSEFDIDNLPWVADGITGDERQAMDHIRAFATIDRSMSQRVAGSPWLSDGVTEDVTFPPKTVSVRSRVLR